MTYDCYLKNFVRILLGIYLLRAGGQKPLFGTDFELWPNISLQWNMISTIGKKRVNLQGLPYMPQILVQKRLKTGGEFLPTP